MSGCCNQPSTCIREHVSAALIRPLRYVRGLDADGCVSYADAQSLALNVADTNTIDMTLASGIISGQVRISAQANNIITALGDGLFVPRAPVQNVANTQTLTLNLSGTGVLTGQVVVSPNANNQLQVLANGLFVPPPPTPFISAVQDTNTVDLTVSGGTLSAQVLVSPNPGNQLQALPNGLFVPPSAAGITVSDTSTVDLTLSGGNLTADVVVSPNTGNQLQALANGLFVPPYRLQDCAGNAINNGDRVVRCVTSSPVALPLNAPFIGVAPNTAYLIQSASCDAVSPTHDLVVSGGNIVASQRDGLGTYLGAIAIFPNTGFLVKTIDGVADVIDSIRIDNPSNCRRLLVIVRGDISALISSNYNISSTGAFSSAFLFDTSTSSIIAHTSARVQNFTSTPGITNTTITTHQWNHARTDRFSEFGFFIVPPGGSTVIERRHNADSLPAASRPYAYATIRSTYTLFGILLKD